MTPATVQHVFARAGVPIVRYARSPQLCDPHRCVGLDYTGDGLVYLAPRVGPRFQVIVFRTSSDAAQVARLVHGERRGNAVLYELRPSTRIRAIFEKILP